MSKTGLVLSFVLGLSLLTGDQYAIAQDGCLACGVPMFVLYIVMLIWVAYDAKARSMDNVVLWVLVVWLLSIGGLVLYFIFRPKGVLTVCLHCRRKRLRGSTRCPHCRRE